MNTNDKALLIEQVSFVNEAFYLAFESKDIKAMRNIWAEREEIYCLHPGWRPLSGRKEIMESWAAILDNPSQPQISFDNPKYLWTGENTIAVICFERSSGQSMIATNIFEKEEERFKMIFHQSGGCS